MQVSWNRGVTLHEKVLSAEAIPEEGGELQAACPEAGEFIQEDDARQDILQVTFQSCSINKGWS